MLGVRLGAIVLTAAAVSLSLARLAHAGDPREPDGPGARRELVVLGPACIFEGERAFFRSPAHPDVALELRAVREGGAKEDAYALAPADVWPRGRTGKFEVVPVNPGYTAKPLALEVRALPAPVTSSDPIAKRRACVQIFVWDAGKTPLGEVLEQLGSTLGPEETAKAYAVTWTLSGQQATRENVNRAISELAGRGYTIDIFSSVHGYPIGLADGDWTDFKDNPGMRAVRLHYTTSCYGADGAEDFLAAGVRTYVASKRTNYVSSFHAARFLEHFEKGRTVRRSTDRAFRSLEKTIRSPLLRDAIESLIRTDDGCSDDEDLDKILEGSRPVVFGDPLTTIDSELAPPPRERR